MAEVSTRIRLDYEGPDSKANRQGARSEDLTPFRPRKVPEVKHHALAYMEQAQEEEIFAAMDLIGTLVEGAKEVLGSNLSEEEYDLQVTELLLLSNEKGSALARGELPCFALSTLLRAAATSTVVNTTTTQPWWPRDGHE